MASRIASFVGTVQLRLKIEQATSTEDEPTPIYLLDEVVQAIGSTSKNVVDALDILQQRLQHRSPTVKQKALKLIKHAAQRGSPELRRALARHSSSIRDLTHFKCAPDAFKGDIPWKRVQEYAREALDTLHAAPGTQNASSFTSSGLGGVGASGHKMEGFGNDSGFGGGASSSSGMLGFGSESVGYQYGGGRDASSGAAPYRAPIRGGGLDLSSGGAVLESLSYGVRDLTDRAVEALTRPEHRRLNSVDSDNSGHGYGIHNSNTPLGGGGGSRGSVMLDRSPGPSPSSSSQQQQQQSREYRLVDRICTPSGMRVAPNSEDLDKFINDAAALDGVELASALQHKLEIGSWQETLRALCVIEALLEKSATSPTAGEVAVHFQAGVSVIRRAQQSTQATVRQRAERVLKLLGADTLPGEGNLSGSKTAAAAAGIGSTQQDLLGGDNLILNAASASNFQNDTTSSNANAMDLLAGLNAASEQSGGTDVFGDWADSTAAMPAAAPTAAASPQQNAGAGGVDLLDALTDLSLSKPHAVPTTPSMPSMHSTGPLDDIFSIPSPAPGIASAVNVGAALQFSNGVGNVPMQYQPVGAFTSSGVVGSAPLTAVQQQQPLRTASLGLRGDNSGGSGVNNDVLRAINAATSGITSTKREEVAFDFVTTAMAQLKAKK
ncbi:hypothetical protein Ndes2526B_g02709 [Nannochloris sp. 'desiccata']|nr:putative Protein MODIFIED TRANSPORT TO THE VACUOLE 1 [Chlorella desiccata (nom. nud.)]